MIFFRWNKLLLIVLCCIQFKLDYVQFSLNAFNGIEKLPERKRFGRAIHFKLNPC